MSKKKEDGYQPEPVVHPSLGRKMQEVNLKSMEEEIAIIAAGDFHIGSSSCNIPALKEFVRQVVRQAETHQVFLIGMGDIFDCITPKDKRHCTNSVDPMANTLDKAVKVFREIFDPLLSTRKVTWVGSLIGNHELKCNGGETDMIERLAETCRIEHLGMKCFIFFDFKYRGQPLLNAKGKPVILRTVAFHGCKNSRLPQGRYRIMREFLKENQFVLDDEKKNLDVIKTCQVALMGHTHDVRVDVERAIVPHPRRGSFRTLTQYACNTGTFMDTASFKTNNYATAGGYQPTSVGYIRILVSRTNGLKVEAMLNSGLNPDVTDLPWDQV